MYCLDKLQREIAYFFSKDIRELPKVESLLAEAGYTQIRKGDEIIKLDSALGLESAIAAPRELDRPPVLSHPRDLQSTDSTSKILESQAEQKSLFDTQAPAETPAQKVDSSVETKELHTKTTSKLTKDELDNLPVATAQEYGEFLEKIAQKDYQNTPEILKIATLNNDLQELINNNHSASVFITRARAGHISEARKGEYDQALTLEEQKQIPAEIAQAKQAYADDKSGFILPFADKNNSEKINLIILDSDSKGNFLITAKKVNSAELNNPKYKKLARAGVEPATTTPPKAEQKPTEAISLARDEIIPQSTAPLSKQAKDYEKIQNKALKYNKLLKELFILFDKNPAAFNKKFEVFKQARNSLIDTLARDFKVAHFTKQLFDPLKMNNALHAAGFGYKTKKFRDGTLRVSGHIPTHSAIQKESRLSDMERERLQLAFAREYNIQDFLNDTHRQDFFTRLSDAVRNHFEFLHTYKTDVNKFLYTENRILPTDKITQAKQKLQKEREAFKEFLESNTPPKDTPTPPTSKGLFDEVDSSLATPKQKTIEKVDSYAKSDEFKTLSKDKQEAILSLKTIEPSPMPQEITQENLENLFRHFNSKQDKAQREFYAKLFNDTKENPHITLEVKRDNETRQEYIKAYQHKDTHDLYYIAITKENDTIKVTGYPITKIKDVINQIKNAEKVVWRHQGDQTHTALDSKESLSLENASDIIPQQKPYTDEKKTLQGFEQAIAGKDTHTKIQIAKEHLEYLHTPLKEQKDQLKELIKTKNFDDDEIAEALQRIETTAKPYAKKRGNIFVPFVDKPGTGWLISDKLTPLEQAKTLIAYELERENKQFFTQVSKLGDELRFLDRFKGVLQEKSAQEWHFREFDETLDFIAKELKKHDKQDKDAKSYEMTYTQARDLFYKASPTQIQTELFEKVLPIAQKLGVNIRSAVRFRYERASSDFTKDIAGMYRTNPNAATLKKGISQEIKHEVLLHELIHSVTSRAIYAYDRGQLDLLTTPQQNAIKNIKEIYAELFSKRDELGLKRWQGKEHTGDYGLKNEHEMLAELANPRFVEKLKNIGLFEKLVDNIIKLIASAKEIFGLKKTNAYERLKGELESIITNYKDDFSTQWEAQKFRDRAMGSEKVDSSKITIAQEPTEPKTLSPQEAKELLESKQGQRLPQELDIQSFLKSLESVENKENFIAHLQKKDDAQSRLAYLHIVEPTLKTPDIELTKGERKTKIKVFNDGENFYSFLIADLADKRLFTFLPKARKGYIETKIKNADLIQTFTSQASKDQEPNGLARHSIAQDSNALLESTMKKFNYDGRKAKDLLEWHKDSHPLTKDKNGVPKVFYHGTKWREIGNKIFEVFDTKYSNQVDKFLQGHYFSSSKKIARTYNANNIYKVFLNAKNPLVIDFKGHTFNDYIDEAINNIPKSVQENIRDFYDSIIFKNIIDDNTQNGKKHPVADTIMVLDSNQIKHIENRGIESEQGRKYFNESSPNIFHSNPHAGAGLLGGSVAGVEQDENGNLTFSPEKFALGLLGGAVGSKAVGKYAIMRRMEAKKHNKKLYNVFKAIDSSAKYGSKMNLIGKENLNADTLAYALARNKRFAINKLDEKVAKELGFKYPQDVRRTIQPDEIVHTLTRHGENSDLARLSGQKPVTLDEIAKYQDYADNAQVKQESKDKSNNRVLISVGQLDNGFLVVIEQIRKGQNELGYKNMYFENGILNDEALTRIFKK